MAKKKVAKKSGGKSHESKVKSAARKTAKKASKSSTKKIWNCEYCLLPDDPVAGHECIPITERELFEAVDEDFSDAFYKLKDFASGLGEQRIYNNARAVMFARRVCYMFVRPKKKYLELCFFLPRKETDPAIQRIDSRSKTKFSHIMRIHHGDQIDTPLTDWIQEAYANAD